MIDIRIICTHDAIPFAETLARLLSAEEHRVRLHYGRQSLQELEAARTGREAVILIWSNDAPSQHYMLEWLHGVEPDRLVEIARAPRAPARAERRAAVIDFGAWRGDRGSRCWAALTERLRAVARHLEPPKPPPKRAALALGLASIAAVTSAMIVRADQQVAETIPAPIEPIVAEYEPSHAIGGPLTAIEPASAEDPIEVRPLSGRMPRLELTQSHLPAPAELAETDLREPTLLERIGEINPLRSRD